MKNKKKIIGILGGMGPQASAKLVSLLVDLSAKEFKAKNGDDFPEIILDSIPIPDFISNKKNKKVALNMLKKRVKMMIRMEVGVFAMSCNTAHILLENLQTESKVPFISIIKEIAKEVKNCGIKKVGLLASPMTFKADLFKNIPIELICPSKTELEDLEGIIRKVITGEIKRKDKLKLIKIARSLQKKGAEGIILGCTELPLIFPKRFEIPIFNSLEILARALLKAHYQERGDRL